MTDNEIIGGISGTIVSSIGVSLSVTDIQAIISIVATIIGLMITITSAVIMPLWNKHKEHVKDGKITPDELKESIDVVVKNKNLFTKLIDAIKKLFKKG